jgi:hypothetical protein
MRNLPPTSPKLANSIDAQVTCAFLSAEAKCKSPKREPWSEKVHFASLQVKYGRLKCAAKANSYDVTATLANVCRLILSTHEIVDDGLGTDKHNLNAAHRGLLHKRRDAEKLLKAFLQELRLRIALRKTSSKLAPEEH